MVIRVEDSEGEGQYTGVGFIGRFQAGSARRGVHALLAEAPSTYRQTSGLRGLHSQLSSNDISTYKIVTRGPL